MSEAERDDAKAEAAMKLSKDFNDWSWSQTDADIGGMPRSALLAAFKGGRASRDPEVAELREKVDELECTLWDEETAHQDTLRLLTEARESLRWAMEEIGGSTVVRFRFDAPLRHCRGCLVRDDLEHKPDCPYALARQRAGMVEK